MGNVKRKIKDLHFANAMKSMMVLSAIDVKILFTSILIAQKYLNFIKFKI